MNVVLNEIERTKLLSVKWRRNFIFNCVAFNNAIELNLFFSQRNNHNSSLKEKKQSSFIAPSLQFLQQLNYRNLKRPAYNSSELKKKKKKGKM